MNRPNAPDPAAWAIHGRLHALRPDVRCVLHVHSEYATAISTLADPEIKPIDQNTARFFKRVAIDLDFGGVADGDEEATRIVNALGDKQCLMMGNHGVLVTGQSVAEAFDTLYYLEKSCRTLAIAYSLNRPLNVMPDELAEKTAVQWEDYRGAQNAHFEELMSLLDVREPDYID
jgi:ribulose-5-phosphate 4-epimerase/fuculose-1-phosphate aldolase